MEQERFQERLQELATAVEELPAVQVEAELPEHGERTLSLMLIVTIALLIGGFGAAVIYMAPRVAVRSTTDQVTALVGDNECAQAMARVVDAISAYTRDHGGPPTRLTDLSPAYLPAPPVDPVTTEPLEYSLSGTSVSLSCPKRAPDVAVPPADRKDPARSSG